MTNRRYPGVSPFTRDQGNIFFGRNNDIDKLHKLISLRKQVLLYSKSGIGKSSLLNAGVIPKLTDKFIPIQIRFFSFDENNFQTPVRSIILAFREAIGGSEDLEDTIIDKYAPPEYIENSLWCQFKKYQLNNPPKGKEKGKDFILIFDQFEELFSYPPEQITEFKDQLYALTRVDVPDSFMEMIQGKKGVEENPQYDALFDSLNIKSVYAVRSDRLNLLNHLTDRITDIQKVYYELNPLDEKQARMAIINPAGQQGEQFETPPFEYEKEAVDSILNALTDEEKKTIETTQLQIVCQTIEDIAASKQPDSSGKIVITVADLPDFKDIFLRFYEDSVKKTDQPEEARIFIENHLIRNNQRISLDENICLDFVSQETLSILVNTHLLRAEQNNVGGKSYELSHDTLLEPIIEVKKERIAREEREAEKIRREEELKLIKEQQAKKLKRNRNIFITVSAIGLGLTIGFYIWKDSQVKAKKLEIQEIQLENQALEKKRAEQAAFIARQNEELALMRGDSLENVNDLLKLKLDSLKVISNEIDKQQQNLEELLENNAVYRNAVPRLNAARNELKVEKYKYEKLFEMLGSNDLLFPVKGEKTGKYGFVNRDGKLRIPYEYDDAGAFNQFGLAVVENGGNEYLIDAKNNRYRPVDNIGSINGDSEAIDLSRKRLNEIPPEIFNTSGLKVLILSDNRLSDLPESLESLRRLEYLDLSDNRFTDLPVVVEKLPSLKYLVLKGNKINDERRQELIDLMGCTILF